MAKRKYVEVEEGIEYAVTCEHGVHFGGYNCVVCHPEKLSSIAWLFSPEMDAAYAAEKAAQQAAKADRAGEFPPDDNNNPTEVQPQGTAPVVTRR